MLNVAKQSKYGDTDAGEIIQELLAKIFSDGALRWAVRALQMNLGAEKPAETWTLNKNMSDQILGCIVNMEGSWTFIQAVAIIALLLKEHLFQDFGIKVQRAVDTEKENLPSDNMIDPMDADNRKYRFLPLLLTITHNNDSMLIKFGDQERHAHAQSRNIYFSFKAYNDGAIVDQFVDDKPVFAPFIEKLKEHLNTYQDTTSRHF
jgi:hypothetical protein